MGRGRKRIILSDSSGSELDDNVANSSTTSQADSHGRASRRAKEGASKKWEALVPGKAKKKTKTETSDVVGQDDENRRSTSVSSAKLPKAAEKVAGRKHEAKSTKRRSKPNDMDGYRAPPIDPNMSSEGENDGEVNAPSNTSAAPLDEASLKITLPPRFRKSQSSKPVSGDDEDDGWNEDDGEHASSPSDGSNKSEATDDDDDDDGLEQMESNPRALEKMLANETPHWVEEDDNVAPRKQSRTAGATSATSRSPSSGSRSHHQTTPSDAEQSERVEPRSHSQSAQGHPKGKKRPAQDDSDPEIERESNGPPSKRPAKKPAKEIASSARSRKSELESGTGGRPQSLASASTRPEKVAQAGAAKSKSTALPEKGRSHGAASKKREAEIPRFKELAIDDDGADQPAMLQSRQGSKSKAAGAPDRRAREPEDADDDLSIRDASASDSESEDSGIDVVFPKRGKLKLTEQHRRVRRVIHRGIFTMLTDVAIKNAFPDGAQRHGKVVSRALLKAAADFGYADMVKRLKKKDEYAAELCKIPSQRIPTFRGSVRKLVEGQLRTALGLTFGDQAKGDWLQEGRRYIYPFDYEKKTIESDKPYSPPVYAETLRVAFFKQPASLGFKICQHFESTLPEKPDEKEIPASMLALVATALHAAIEDCKHGYTLPRDFTANEYWGVYRDHIQELSDIRTTGPEQYHVLMHGLWRQISSPAGPRGRVAGPQRKSFLNVAGMARE